MPIRLHARGIVFAIVAFLLVASFLYSRAVRDAYLTEDLRYLPKESALAVVTGDLRSLWLAVDDHFGAVIRGAGDREPGFLAELFGEFDALLDEWDLPVAGLAIGRAADRRAASGERRGVSRRLRSTDRARAGKRGGHGPGEDRRLRGG